MKNMRISLKLMVGFLIMIVLAGLVGGLGIVGMYRINVADVAMYEGNYLPTVLADEISQGIVEQRLYMRNFVIYDVDQDAEIFQKNIIDSDASKIKMEELFTEYDATITNSEDRAAFEEFLQVYHDQWVPLSENVYSLGAANLTQEAKEALITGAAVANRMNELSDKLQEINLADGQKTVNDNTSLFNLMTLLEVGALVFALALALFLAFYISGLISKPMVTLTAFMKKAGSTGDISLSQEDVKNIGSLAQVRDEIGQCIGSTAKFIEHLKEISNQLEVVANGDLTAEIQLLSNQDVIGLSLNKMVTNLNSMFNEINASAAQIATGSKQIANGAQSLAQGSTEQASTVEELSTSIGDIADRTKQNAEVAKEAAELSGTIRGNAEKGSLQMSQMMQAVQEITEASNQIGKVIKVIDNIAFQTNILALNASVEAARAGQHGSGFAVVAEEVRNLAVKSADAAKDTGEMIENSIEKANFGLTIASETSASLKEIVEGINRSAEIVAQIARSSDEQAGAISQINIGIDQVAQVVQQNSATAQQSAAASEEMSGQSEMLEQLVSQFTLKASALPANYSAPSGKRTLSMSPSSEYSGSRQSMDYGKY